MKTGPAIPKQNDICKTIQVSFAAQEQHKLYESINDVNKNKIQKQHEKLTNEVRNTIEQTKALIPSFQDYINFQRERTKNPILTDFESSQFYEALELNQDNHDGEIIEMKNEEFATLTQQDMTALSVGFVNLQILNLSMNKIQSIESSFDLPHLKQLILADNLLKAIHPFMFTKLPKLQVLDLSINQIEVIQNLDKL